MGDLSDVNIRYRVMLPDGKPMNSTAADNTVSVIKGLTLTMDVLDNLQARERRMRIIPMQNASMAPDPNTGRRRMQAEQFSNSKFAGKVLATSVKSYENAGDLSSVVNLVTSLNEMVNEDEVRPPSQRCTDTTTDEKSRLGCEEAVRIEEENATRALKADMMGMLLGASGQMELTDGEVEQQSLAVLSVAQGNPKLQSPNTVEQGTLLTEQLSATASKKQMDAAVGQVRTMLLLLLLLLQLMLLLLLLQLRLLLRLLLLLVLILVHVLTSSRALSLFRRWLKA